MSEKKELAALVDELKGMLGKRRTGTMFLKGDDTHAYAVAFEGGRIVAVWSGITVGNAAIEKLCTVKYATSRFSSGAYAPAGSEPDPSHVARLLKGGNEPASGQRGEIANGQGDETAPEFHRLAVDTIQTNLLDVLGPFATYIVEDALKKAPYHYVSAGNLPQVLSLLAAEIDDVRQAERFVQSTSLALNVKLVS